MKLNSNNHDRGLHIVVFDVFHGKIQESQIFDTYSASKPLESFIQKYPKGFKSGQLIVIASKDDCVTHLSDISKKWLNATLGSNEI